MSLSVIAPINSGNLDTHCTLKAEEELLSAQAGVTSWLLIERRLGRPSESGAAAEEKKKRSGTIES